VTICAAGISGGQIVAVKDMKLSYFGGAISSEGVLWKQRTVNSQWQVMFSGDISTLTPMLDAIEEAGKKSKEKGLRQFARLCAAAYREERKRIIEDEVLPDYDLSAYAEYSALKSSDPDLFDAIGTKIKEAEEGWHLLFCGFDSKRKPHLFVISGRGKIQYCDTAGFAAIGSGGWAAHIALATYPYSPTLAMPEAAYCLLAAKFAAEAAEGVGKETYLHVFAPGEELYSFVMDKTIESVREKWRSLPRIPDGAADEIKAELDKYEGLMKRARIQSKQGKKSRTLAALA
jgi:hypothetical protein